MAAAAFARKGYNATTMEEIAHSCGLTKPALYLYFRGKEELLYELNAMATRLVLDHARDVQQRALPPDEKLRLIMRHQVHVIAAYPEVCGVLVRQYWAWALSPRKRKRISAIQQQYEQVVRSVLQEGVQEGIFRPLDPVVTSHLILGAINYMTYWYHRDGRLPPDQVADIVVDYLLGGLVQSAGRSPVVREGGGRELDWRPWSGRQRDPSGSRP
ncbi:MAG: TetR family transcriptional regulator [Clostridia bacterium]|nr:TetR family transcriptional regulator [Clostridia bacterium]